MSTAVQILPKTHILQGIVAADNWTPAKAISEFVDNSFGDAAGNADLVVITICKNSIYIDDNGDGMESVASLFILGQSGSFASTSDIGRYGRGAKEACIWLGEHTFVETFKGHKKTSCDVDWQRLINQGPDAPWPTIVPYSEIVKECEIGTHIMISGLRRKQSIKMDALARALGETYAMAIRAGKVIRLVDARRTSCVEVDVEPYQPDGWSDIVTFEGCVDGKAYRAEVGVLSDVYSSHTGIRLCYGHRIVERKTQIAGRGIPARIFGYVMLSNGWKENLATNKTQIIDSESLEADILAKCADVFSLAQEYQEDVVIEGLNVQLSSVLTDSFRKDDDGDEEGTRKPPKFRKSRSKKKHPCPPGVLKTGGVVKLRKDDQKNDMRGLRIKTDRLGEKGRVGVVQEDASGLTISINKDSPLVRKAISDQQGRGRPYTAGYVMMIGFVLAAHAEEQGIKWAEKWFKKKIEQEDGTRLRVSDAIMVWWSCEATRPIWDGSE